MSVYVNCPICGDCDMEKVKDDDGFIIHCTNLACASNGGNNADEFLANRNKLNPTFIRDNLRAEVLKKVISMTIDAHFKG